jgi:hypothetical protein
VGTGSPPSTPHAQPGRHVFISYARENQDYVDRLVAHLGEANVSTWSDDRMEWGSSFRRQIQDAIDSCAAFVVVMSPDSVQSAEVEAEVEWALHQKKLIFPLLFGGERFFRLATYQYLDVSDGTMPDQRWVEGLQRLTSG